MVPFNDILYYCMHAHLVKLIGIQSDKEKLSAFLEGKLHIGLLL